MIAPYLALSRARESDGERERGRAIAIAGGGVKMPPLGENVRAVRKLRIKFAQPPTDAKRDGLLPIRQRRPQ